MNKVLYKIQPKTAFIGQIYKYLPSCQSTNDEASALIASANPIEGTLVTTDHQVAGRGQRGNTWESHRAENLTFSILLKPDFLAPGEQFWLTIAISLGVYDTLRPLLGESVRIKWPNDIYVNDQKLGGILIENTIQRTQLTWSVVGIGLNINQTEFRYPAATSLQQQSPLPGGYDRPGMLALFCETIEKRYLQLRTGQRDTLKADYLRVLYRYQQEHNFSTNGQPFCGTIAGIDPVGRLGIETGETVRYFDFKEVAFL